MLPEILTIEHLHAAEAGMFPRVEFQRAHALSSMEEDCDGFSAAKTGEGDAQVIAVAEIFYGNGEQRGLSFVE